MKIKAFALLLSAILTSVLLPATTVLGAFAETGFDDFERVELGPDWTPASAGATWSIAADPKDPNNRTMSLNPAGNHTISAGDTTWTNYTATAKILFTATNNGYPGLITRFSNAQNYYLFRINFDTSKQFEIYSFHGGSNALLTNKKIDGSGVEINSNTWYTLKTVVEGFNLKCYITPEGGSEVVIFDYTDPNSRHEAGCVGFRTNQTITYMDDVTVTFPDPSAVPIPTLSLAGVTETTLSLSWNSVATATGYKIFRSTELEGTYELIHTINDAKNTYTDLGLTTGQMYHYKVKAVKDAYESEYSNAISARPDYSATITFDSNGGNSVPEAQIAFGMPIPQPTTPIRAGYSFCGWYSDYQFENAFDFTTALAGEDITLYAKWAHTGNSINRTNGIKTISALTTFEQSAARMPKWFNALDDLSSDKQVVRRAEETRPITVFLELDKSYTLSCIGVVHFTSTCGVPYTISGADESVDDPLEWDDSRWVPILSVNDNQGENRRFAIDNYSRYKYIRLQIHSNVGSWVGFRAIEFFGRSDFDFTVDFETGDGIEPVSSVRVDYGEKPSDPNLSKEGKVLVGWYADPTFMRLWDFDKNYIIDNTTLYAAWEPQLPVASGLQIQGEGFLGNELRGSYTSFTAQDGHNESGSSAIWYRADDDRFRVNLQEIKRDAISNNAISTYTLAAADDGKFIQFTVIPKSDGAEDNVGKPVSVSLPNAVRAAVTTPNVTLTAPYAGLRVHENTPISLSAIATAENTTVTKIEYYADTTMIAQSTTYPFDAEWSNPGPGEYQISARAYNALGETGDSPTASIKVYPADQSIEPVLAEKWSYDFNEFTQQGVFDSSNNLAQGLPGSNPPTISYQAGGSFQSANGIYGKAAQDYHFQSNSLAGGNREKTRLVFPLNDLDIPIKTMYAEIEVAFSSTSETDYILSYDTPYATYNTFFFTSSGRINYFTGSGSSNTPFTDQQGDQITYTAERWYRVGVLFDFENKEVTYYLDGDELLKKTAADPDRFTRPTNLRITGSTNSQTGVVYFDNMLLAQVQDSYVNACITSPLARYTAYHNIGYKYPTSYHLTDSAIAFKGYAKDGRGTGIAKTELLLNGVPSQEVAGDTFDYTKADIPPGKYIAKIKATAVDGLVGYSDEVPLIVSAVSLPSMYGNNMLLQRNKDIKLEGMGKNGESVTIKLNGQTRTSAIVHDKWSVVFPPQAANKKTTLEIVTSEGVIILFDNVAIGELLLTYGQSNMRYELEKYSNLTAEADQHYQDIRLFNPSFSATGTEQTDVTGVWATAAPINMLTYSAVGILTAKYYYLANNGEIPVGLVNASEGGAGIQTFAPTGAYQHDPDLTDSGSTNYKAGIAPWKNYTFGTLLYYQGEANTQLSTPYEKLLTQKIDAYRSAFNDPTLNFIIVQLPAYDYPGFYSTTPNRSAMGTREAQWNVSERINGVETVVAVDLGNYKDIHPNDKKPIAERASLILEHFTNPENKSLVWRSPSYSHHEVNNGTMTIHFKDIGDGIHTKDYESTELDATKKAVRGFTLADSDGVFQPVDAQIVGDTIQIDVSSVTVGEPKVRYAFTDTPPTRVINNSTRPDFNLVNSAKLPMAPFRTDTGKINLNTALEFVNFAPAIRNITAGKVTEDGKCTITVKARDYDGGISKLEVYKDNLLLGEATQKTEDTFTYVWNGAATGTFSFHAIATDNEGTTSVTSHSTMGGRTATPQRFALTITQGPDEPFFIYPFEDLSGKEIDSFAGENGVTATADLKETGAVLIFAAYQEETLLKAKLSREGTASFTADELADATRVAAYVWYDFTGIVPAGAYKDMARD